MIDTNGVSSVPLAAGTSAAERTALGRNDFMALLLTQLRHQDPMSPLEPHEFASQLATFSSVDELAQIKDGMGYQLESLQLSTIMSKTSFSASLIGRSVVAEGNRLSVSAGGEATLVADVGAGGGTATLRVLDDSGAEVATKDLGEVAGGRRSFTVDDLPEGSYSYELSVTDSEGGDVSVTTYTSGTVDRVLFEDGRIVLRIGGMNVVLESLIEIGTNLPHGA